MRITRENSVALIIDLQEKLVPVMRNKKEVIKNNQIVISGLKELGVPTIFSQQYPKGLGETIEEIKSLVEDFISFDKADFSCYGHEMCKSFLHANEAKNVIITGIESHICVLQTALDLKDAGYNPIVVVDAVDSRKKSDKKVALRRFESEGITLTTYESILFELAGSAKAPAFKAISKLIK
ncbi:isochorismatase family protein [Halosquirtibacter xylanolyticus]|uniref:isochorismatase family protein n=1 Tax=Halosquirtibacter xylanolyticus TaxID=3374599 RepID=UPI0037479127|nr:isochorismatase family protein [Prolixibacteraceae bacterium]